MLEMDRTLRYLAQASAFGEGANIPYGAGAPQWTLSLEEARAGRLSMHLTREVLLAYSAAHPEVAFGGMDVRVALCVRMLRTEAGACVPLLVIPGELSADGALLPATDCSAWVPRSRLAGEDLQNSNVCVCDVDAWRAHQEASLTLGAKTGWSEMLQSAEELFDAACTLEESELESARLTRVEGVCIMRLWERVDDTLVASSVLAGRSCRSLEELARLPIGRLLGVQGESDADPDAKDSAEHALPDDALLDPKLVCGVLGHFGPLDTEQRDALARFAAQSEGDVFALAAPSGTHRLETLLCMMANTLTEAALRGNKAPVQALVADADDIDAVLALLSRRSVASQSSPLTRWLPRISGTQGYADKTSQERRVLGPLGALCLLQTADGVRSPTTGSYLSQPLGHARGGSAELYADPWYLPAATTYFLDCASAFLGEKAKTPEEAAHALEQRLRTIDQLRCEFIDSYAGVCRAALLMKKREDLVARVGRLRRGHTICRSRLAYWSDLAKEQGAHRPIFGEDAQATRELVEHNALKGENLALGCADVAGVVAAYTAELEKIESTIDRLRAATANLGRRIRAASPYGDACNVAIDKLCAACRLDSEQRALLEASLDGRGHDVSMEYLDHILNQTVRSHEFWISLHVYEARWLVRCANEGALPRTAARVNQELLCAWAELCPILLVPAELAVASVGAFTPGGPAGIAMADVVYVASGDAVGPVRAAALACLSKRLVAAGSASSFNASPLMGPTYDELRCARTEMGPAWEELRQSPWSVSGGSTLFLATELAGVRCALSRVDAPYADLCDLRSDLQPQERVDTRRTPAHAADDEQYPLLGLLPSLSYVLVPDSAWEQRAHSRQNRPEALALRRWLQANKNALAQRYRGRKGEFMAIFTPYAAHADLLRSLLAEEGVLAGISVRTLTEAGRTTWPLVVLASCCGPDAFRDVAGPATSRVLLCAAAHATDALVLFCGGAWTRTLEGPAALVLRRAARAGRVFSLPRSGRRSSPILRSDLRAKPLSLSSLLKRLGAQGTISHIPPAPSVNRALEQVGLIERVENEGGKGGWRPTAAGREVGILATSDMGGKPFCVYSTAAEQVVASVVATMGRW